MVSRRPKHACGQAWWAFVYNKPRPIGGRSLLLGSSEAPFPMCHDNWNSLRFLLTRIFGSLHTLKPELGFLGAAAQENERMVRKQLSMGALMSMSCGFGSTAVERQLVLCVGISLIKLASELEFQKLSI